VTSTGRPVRRLEDADLLLGRGRCADDLLAPRRTLYAAILRSPHPHAKLLSLEADHEAAPARARPRRH
jgi:2-furoyl-CoA dehydrogenase large subunit